MNRVHKIIPFLFVILKLLILPCDADVSSFPITITGRDDSIVRIERKPQRIISLTASTTEVLFSLGLGDRVIAVSQDCNYPPQVRGKEVVTSYYINYEKIVSLKPDLIVVDSSSNFTDPAKLRKLNIPILLVHSDSFPNLLNSIQTIGRATGREEAAKRYIADLKREIDEISRKAQETFGENKPRVCVVIWNNPLMIAGSDTFINFIIETAGGINVVGNLKGYPQISPELLLARNPDFIILTKINPEEFTSGKIWRNIKAVRDNHVYDVNPDVFVRPGIRSVEGCRLLFDLFTGKVTGEKK
jgi:iron complex transport system substrate-binding protein